MITLILILLIILIEKSFAQNFYKRGDGATCIDYALPSEFDNLLKRKIAFKSKKETLRGFVYKDKSVTNFKAVIVIAHGIGYGHFYLLNLVSYFAKNGYIVFCYDQASSGMSSGKKIDCMSRASLDIDNALRFKENDNELKNYENQDIILQGFVDKIRNLQYVQFIILRDSTGKVQITIEKNEENGNLVNIVDNMTLESTLKIKGKVILNEKVKLGGVEIIPEQIEVTSKSLPELPLDIKSKDNSLRETRLDYRFLDLRREENNLFFNSGSCRKHNNFNDDNVIPLFGLILLTILSISMQCLQLISLNNIFCCIFTVLLKLKHI